MAADRDIGVAPGVVLRPEPREFDDSIDRTDKEESLWKTFWQTEGVNANEVMYRRALRQTHQLDALEAD